jgi:hypothetical protein
LPPCPKTGASAASVGRDRTHEAVDVVDRVRRTAALRGERTGRLAPQRRIRLRAALGRRLQRLDRRVEVDARAHRPLGALVDERPEDAARRSQPDLAHQRLEVVAARLPAFAVQPVQPGVPGLLQQRRAVLGQLAALAGLVRQRPDQRERAEPAVEGGDLRAARMAQHRLVESARADGERVGPRLAESVPAGELRVQRRVVVERQLAQRRGQPLAHLVRGEPGEGDREHLVGLRALEQRPHDPSDQQRRLAAAGAGVDDHAARRVDRHAAEGVRVNRHVVEGVALAGAAHDQCPLRHSPRLAHQSHSLPQAAIASPPSMRAR